MISALASSGCRRFRRIRRDRRGSVLVEFALGAPVLILVVIGVFEVSLLMLGHILLEGGIRMASRFGVTGQEIAGLSREAYVESMIRDQSAGLLDIRVTSISTRVYADFAAIENGSFEDGAGAGNDVVLYSVDAEWRTITPLLAGLMGTDGLVPLHAEVAVRNEPFGLDALPGSS
ncbi:TadE/TadG family type IV pilus assembly protein [Marinivivus vitaminiproducens]|uniref:TadE/TadG family type IV pilus assembly protein n=1 Tax=Marinivivus vitaminiproducens TaxID=3035935 RepID=UPI00279FFD02|nr:pilus assembly protein [Geminicoccaceae bacterium SCSIO 64248]